MYWALVGWKGEQGERGRDGAPGEPGAPGPQGPAGEQTPISDSVTSPDSGVAASSKAVKTAHDKAATAQAAAEAAQAQAEAVGEDVTALRAELAACISAPVLITESGTWTPPATGWYWLEVLGGGGAGGSAAVTGVDVWVGGGGGASGGYEKALVRIDSPAPIAVIVGAGGSPVAGSSGGDGGVSSFGEYLSASGGGGGQGNKLTSGQNSYFGLGGKAFSAGGNHGQPSGWRYPNETVASFNHGHGGRGAGSPLGIGGDANAVNKSGRMLAGGAAAGYGAGGGGAVAYGAGSSALGGKGAQGCVKLTRVAADL